MASHQQTRIQAYLEKNKIGPLFEELMTKLITETPDQPIPFLIDHLQSKQGHRGHLKRTLSGSAALWAESEKSENKGTRRDFRSYDKPWQVNAKKPKKSKSDLAVSNISPPSPESKSLPRSVEHPKWDWRTKPDGHDFDELNHILQESKKLGKALENLSRSIAISDELDTDAAAFNAPLLRPRVIGEWVGREENDADPLAAEMLKPPIPRSKNEQWDSEDSSSSPGGSLKMEPKTKGLKQQQQQHKKLLAAMLSQESFDSVQSTAPSVTEEDIDNEDDAMELLEDLDDLRMEGVTSVMSSGSKFNQTRSTHTAEPQAKVTLNICARFARLQGDNLAERTEDVSIASQTLEQAISDSNGRLEYIGIYVCCYHSKPPVPGLHVICAHICEEFLHQLQLAHHPWVLPSDTESEGVEADQDEREYRWLFPLSYSACQASLCTEAIP
uniref:Chromosome 8 open reading frame 34 n=1 Tax=Sphenodon punctatus TaxID=8508 RepID=A0A8D0G7L8_SPHPU